MEYYLNVFYTSGWYSVILHTPQKGQIAKDYSSHDIVAMEKPKKSLKLFFTKLTKAGIRNHLFLTFMFLCTGLPGVCWTVFTLMCCTEIIVSLLTSARHQWCGQHRFETLTFQKLPILHHIPLPPLFFILLMNQPGRSWWPSKPWRCSSCRSSNPICAGLNFYFQHVEHSKWLLTPCCSVSADAAVHSQTHFPSAHLQLTDWQVWIAKIISVFGDVWMMSPEAVCKMQMPWGRAVCAGACESHNVFKVHFTIFRNWKV